MKKICSHALEHRYICNCTAAVPRKRKSKKSWICETCLVTCKWINYKEEKNGT